MTELVALADGTVWNREQLHTLLEVRTVSPTQQLETVQGGDWLLVEAHRHDAPLSGPRSFENERWSAVFAGDLVDCQQVPFQKVFDAIEERRLDELGDLNGIFAIVIFDKLNKKLLAISDRRSQKPVFVYQTGRRVHISTSLAIIARLEERLAFDERALWAALYFNFPVDDTTFLTGVSRLPPATLFSYDTQSGVTAQVRYVDRTVARQPLWSGAEALELAAETFGQRCVAHYTGSQTAACALTGGWDGRTMLALAPPDKEVTAYTYGVPGCSDMNGARETATAVDVHHIQIPFEEKFVSDLPRYMLETVYLSGGLQGVLRATLLHVYETLTSDGQRYPLTISGISLGTQLRGAAQYPDLISMEMAHRFQGFGPAHTEEYWRAILGDRYRSFAEFTVEGLEQLERQFGPFDQGEHHLSYTVYPASAHYFCGELSISDRYTTVRVPAWDRAIVDLVYSIENSTLTYSHFLTRSRKVRRTEMVLQAYLLRRFSPTLYRVPVRGIHPAAVLAGEIPYQLERAYRSLGRKLASGLRGHREVPLENWNSWLFDQNKDFISEMLESADTRIGAFVSREFVKNTVAGRDVRMIGKLMTIEIILRLIESGWRRFW